ncbi:MAG: hypothetical protein ACE5K7_07550, partial [Phycisphaerae bacterium]
MLTWRVTKILILSPIAVLACLGCQDIDWRWEWDWWRRPARPIRPARTPPPPATEPTQAQPPPAEPAPLGLEPVTEPPVPPARPGEMLYQIQLCTGPTNLTSPEGIRRIRLQAAPAGPAARVLEILFPPIGAGGTDTSPYLVYQDRTMWISAGYFADQLDCPAIQTEPGEAPASSLAAFRRAVGLFYQRWRPAGRIDKPGLRRIIQLLTGVADNSDTPNQFRWAAALLAGYIHDQFFYEFGSARQMYSLAR